MSDSEHSSPTHIKQYDPITFDVLRVNLDDLAGQITLNDLEIFKKISVSELLSCSWTKKSKWEDAPNIAEFTQAFNSHSYLACREILAGQTPDHRAQLITYFIKLSKKLYQLNNLHSTWAIISALLTQPIFRLNQTWQKVNKSDRQQMQRLTDLFSSKDNFVSLRNYMNSASMPCIPHLGLYLTDLIFMHDMLKKTKNVVNRKPVEDNIDKLLRSLCSFQDSCYEIPYKSHIQAFLADAELPLQLVPSSEKLFYQLSLRLEPEQCPSTPNGKTTERRSSLPLQAIRSLTHSVSKFSPNTIAMKSPRRRKKSLAEIASNFSPGFATLIHLRNGRSSLGDNESNGVDNASYTSTTDPQSQTKWYDTLENDEDDLNQKPNPSRMSKLTARLKSIDIYDASPQKWKFHSAASTPQQARRRGASFTPEILRKHPVSPLENRSLIGDSNEIELAGSFVKTQVRGNHSKNKLLRTHQTCYLELRGNNLVEYEKKLVPLYVNDDRELFQQRPKRILNLANHEWTVSRADPNMRSGFELHERSSGRSYHYACKSWSVASHWIQMLRDAMDVDALNGCSEINGRNCARLIEATRL